MGGPRYGPIAAWTVGFVSVLGQIAGVAGVAYTIGASPARRRCRHPWIPTHESSILACASATTTPRSCYSSEQLLKHRPSLQLPLPAPVDVLAVVISQYVLLATGGAAGGGTQLSAGAILGCHIGLLLVFGLLNSFSTRILDLVNVASGERLTPSPAFADYCCSRLPASPQVLQNSSCSTFALTPTQSYPAPAHLPSVWFHAAGVPAFVIALLAIAPVHQPASWALGAFAPDKAFSGISNSGFSFLLSLLGSQWGILGWV